jgi:hypothetical protein
MSTNANANILSQEALEAASAAVAQPVIVSNDGKRRTTRARTVHAVAAPTEIIAKARVNAGKAMEILASVVKETACLQKWFNKETITKAKRTGKTSTLGSDGVVRTLPGAGVSKRPGLVKITNAKLEAIIRGYYTTKLAEAAAAAAAAAAGTTTEGGNEAASDGAPFHLLQNEAPEKGIYARTRISAAIWHHVQSTCKLESGPHTFKNVQKTVRKFTPSAELVQLLSLDPNKQYIYFDMNRKDLLKGLIEPVSPADAEAAAAAQ